MRNYFIFGKLPPLRELPYNLGPGSHPVLSRAGTRECISLKRSEWLSSRSPCKPHVNSDGQKGAVSIYF